MKVQIKIENRALFAQISSSSY